MSGTSPSKSGILVIGAGELGTAVIESIAKRPSQQSSPSTITVLVSESSNLDNPSISPSKKALLQHFSNDLGIKIHPFDLNSASTSDLASTLRPYHTIISCTGFSGPPGLQKKIAEAVLAEETPHYMPWQFGVDYDIIGRGSSQELFTEQLDVRALLRGQTKTEWNIVSVGLFMSVLFDPAFGVVDASNKNGEVIVRALGGWDYEFTATTAVDIGRCVAEIILGPEDNRRNKDGVIFIAGDTLTYSHLANELEKVSGRPLRRELWSLEYLRGELAKDPENVYIKYRCIWADGKGVAWSKEKSLNGRLGIEMETAAQYADRNRAGQV